MSFETTRTLIAAKLATLTEATLGFPVEWEGGTNRGQSVTWGRWTIQQASTQPATIGGGHTRGTGMVTLQIFIPEAGGTKAAPAAADRVALLLDRVQLKSGGTVVTFDTTGMIDAGRRDGYTQKNIVCSFTRDTYS